jgi:hypothetical protein
LRFLLSSRELCADDFLNLSQGFVCSRWILASSLSEIGPAAAAAANNGRDFFDYVSGMDPFGEIAARARHKTHSVVSLTGEKYKPAGDPFFQLIGKLPQLLRIDSVNTGD